MIGEYTPIRIDTTAADFTSTYPFEPAKTGVGVFSVPLDTGGGLEAQFIETTSSDPHAYTGNYVLVLKGRCTIEDMTFGEATLVVGKVVEPRAYAVTAPKGSSCLAMGVSLQ